MNSLKNQFGKRLVFVNHKGSSSIMVLLIGLTLLTLATAFVSLNHTILQGNTLSVQGTAARYLAEGGVFLAAKELQNPRKQQQSDSITGYELEKLHLPAGEETGKMRIHVYRPLDFSKNKRRIEVFGQTGDATCRLEYTAILPMENIGYAAYGRDTVFLGRDLSVQGDVFAGACVNDGAYFLSGKIRKDHDEQVFPQFLPCPLPGGGNIFQKANYQRKEVLLLPVLWPGFTSSLSGCYRHEGDLTLDEHSCLSTKGDCTLFVDGNIYLLAGCRIEGDFTFIATKNIEVSAGVPVMGKSKQILRLLAQKDITVNRSLSAVLLMMAKGKITLAAGGELRGLAIADQELLMKDTAWRGSLAVRQGTLHLFNGFLQYDGEILAWLGYIGKNQQNQLLSRVFLEGFP